MNPVTSHFAAVMLLSSALGLGEGPAFAQSGGRRPVAVHRAADRRAAPSAGASRGSGSAGSVGRTGGASRHRVSRRTGSGVGTNNPRSLSNQPATSTSPGSTAPGTYAPGAGPAPAGTSTPSGRLSVGPAFEAARQRALQGPAGTVNPPTAAGVGADRSSTSEVGSDSVTEPERRASQSGAIEPRYGRQSGERMAGGGSSNRQGATGATMQECEAAWDAETHMSKDKWRETCRHTLTAPHLDCDCCALPRTIAVVSGLISGVLNSMEMTKMTDTRPPYRGPRNSSYAGWLVALGVVVFSIFGLAVWDYKIDHRPNQTTGPGENDSDRAGPINSHT